MGKKFFARLKEFPSLEEAMVFVIAWNDENTDESMRDAPSY